MSAKYGKSWCGWVLAGSTHVVGHWEVWQKIGGSRGFDERLSVQLPPTCVYWKVGVVSKGLVTNTEVSVCCRVPVLIELWQGTLVELPINRAFKVAPCSRLPLWTTMRTKGRACGVRCGVSKVSSLSNITMRRGWGSSRWKYTSKLLGVAGLKMRFEWRL